MKLGGGLAFNSMLEPINPISSIAASFLSPHEDIEVMDVKFDSSHQTISVSDDKITAAQRKMFGGTNTILGDILMPEKGISQFTVEIENTGMKGVRIGVAEVGYDCRKKIGRDEISWGLHSNGKLYHNGHITDYCHDLKSKTRVTVTLKRAEGALFFKIDDVDQGRAYLDPKLENMQLYPAL